MSDLISAATRRNWDRLKVNHESGKLTSRANKRLSERQFIPVEYMSDCRNIAWLKSLQEEVKAYGWNTADVLYTIGICLLEQKDILKRAHVQAVLDEYTCQELPLCSRSAVPDNEHDLLGLIYQALRTEGEKNRGGAYYTGEVLTREMTADLVFSDGEILFDPCCGSGAFLLAAEGAGPDQLAGMDLDPTAVMIARINLLCHFPRQEFVPRITCGDYLAAPPEVIPDYLITNPPWGAMTSGIRLAEFNSRETFSCFLVQAYRQLKAGGVLRFLLPDSIRNIKAHEEIRRYLLAHGNLSRITCFEETFSGVMTKYISLEMRKETAGENVCLKQGDTRKYIARERFLETKHCVFHLLDEQDFAILDKIRRRGRHTLARSRFALGIVTGNNKELLKDAFFPGSEIIYTGKDITPYCLKPAVKYIYYDRDSFQQAAKEEYYRAPEKLLYRFISKRLVFAYDNRQSLCLNSANILIPDIPGISIKSILALLNSDVYQYIYMSLFEDVKVLKGNLEELPFPELRKEEDEALTAMADHMLAHDGETIHNDIQEFVYRLFDLTEAEQQRIKTGIKTSGRNKS